MKDNGYSHTHTHARAHKRTQARTHCALVSESWEYEGRREDLEHLLAATPYKVSSYRRPRGRRGGCCAVIYNGVRFKVEKVNVNMEEGIETVWVVMTPKQLDQKLQRIKRICIGSVYIAPRSDMKSETVSHIIQTIHYIRSKYDNQVNFVIGGDVNRTDYSDIIDAYGALKQCVTVGIRKEATLDIILSDLMTLYHPPTVKAPLQVDKDKNGVDSDHSIVIFAPKSDPNFHVKREKKSIKTRPLPDSQIPLFGREVQAQSWEEVYFAQSIDEKVQNFHDTILSICDKYFPTKTIQIPNLDKKKWITPELKSLSRKVKKEYFRNRKTSKLRKLKKEFKYRKRKAIRSFHLNFVTDLKASDPGKF